MLTCKEVAQQHASGYIDHNLSSKQRFGVGLHLMMCCHCRRFVKQLRVVKTVLSMKSEDPSEKIVIELVQKLSGEYQKLAGDEPSVQ